MGEVPMKNCLSWGIFIFYIPSIDSMLLERRLRKTSSQKFIPIISLRIDLLYVYSALILWLLRKKVSHRHSFMFWQISDMLSSVHSFSWMETYLFERCSLALSFRVISFEKRMMLFGNILFNFYNLDIP